MTKYIIYKEGGKSALGETAEEQMKRLGTDFPYQIYKSF